jgi:hypothetical protein
MSFLLVHIAMTQECQIIVKIILNTVIWDFIFFIGFKMASFGIPQLEEIV